MISNPALRPLACSQTAAWPLAIWCHLPWTHRACPRKDYAHSTKQAVTLGANTSVLFGTASRPGIAHGDKLEKSLNGGGYASRTISTRLMCAGSSRRGNNAFGC